MPALVSGSARLPYFLAFIGILGGLAAFGLVGLFVAPSLWPLCWQSGASGSSGPRQSKALKLGGQAIDTKRTAPKRRNQTRAIVNSAQPEIVGAREPMSAQPEDAEAPPLKLDRSVGR
ncbi:hypothetical protein ACVMAJ_000083 [Bradyrhizobium sp. USDA 4448]